MVVTTDTISKNQQEIFNNIQNIQTIEKDLYTLLDNLSVVEPDSEMQKKIINQIDSLYQIRVNMLKDLTIMYNNLHTNISDSKINLNDQKNITNIINNELQNATKKLDNLINEKNNKLRMTEINIYHGKKYNDHVKIMKILLITFICVLIIKYISNNELLPIPENILIILISFIIFYGGLKIILLTIDISKRNNINYDKYNWSFQPPDISVPEYVEKERKQTSDFDIKAILNNNDCIGSECCTEEMEYDTATKTCKPKVSSINQHKYLQFHDHESHENHETEGFKNGKPCYPWGKSSINVEPYNSKIFF